MGLKADSIDFWKLIECTAWPKDTISTISGKIIYNMIQ